jgi:peptidoglycan hydrolase-like protein with peptidoglycan-binding domain
LRQCESSGNYSIVATNGHYGAYQFNLSTWSSVGGTGMPQDASPAEQDYRALYLYRMRGWQPWECASIVGLTNDSLARSKLVPSYTDATYMGGSGVAGGGNSTPVSNGGTPTWPGVTYAYGDCAPSLRMFQLQMNKMGYAFDGTGCYYDKTKTAVLELQRANGIKDSGILGPKTWKAAWEGKNPHSS